MNISTIDMPTDLARAAYHQYRALVDSGRGTREDRAVMLGYKAMASGKAVIDLHDVMRAGGLDERGRPKLAFGAANWVQCYWQGFRDGSLTFSSSRRYIHHKSYARKFPPGTLPDVVAYEQWWCVVPTIPPSVRPRNLSAYYLLWEAAWQNVPTDPMLLRHLDGSLYVVLAVWDLSPLECAVLKRRLTQAQT